MPQSGGSFPAHNALSDVVELGYVTEAALEATNTAGLAAAVDDAPEGATIRIPPGTFAGRIAASEKRITIEGAGASTILRANSASPVISIDGGGGIAAGWGLRNMKVVNDGAGNGVELRNVHRSQFDNVVVTKAGNAGWYLYGCLLNQFNACAATRNESVPVAGAFKYGLVLDYDPTLASGCNANVFVNFIAEGMDLLSPGVGIEFLDAEGNVFLGGVSEGNTIGMRFNHATAVRQNVILGTWFEDNGTDLSGTLTQNLILRREGVGSKLRFNVPLSLNLAGRLYFLNEIEGSESSSIISGSGSPEAAYTAPPGSLYLRTNGGPGASFYVKESGAGNTGWVAK